jgi:hypothetical protein
MRRFPEPDLRLLGRFGRRLLCSIELCPIIVAHFDERIVGNSCILIVRIPERPAEENFGPTLLADALNRASEPVGAEALNAGGFNLDESFHETEP